MTAVSVTVSTTAMAGRVNSPSEVSTSSSLEPVVCYDTRRIKESKAHRSKKTMTT